jgi:hypothetical protein
LISNKDTFFIDINKSFLSLIRRLLGIGVVVNLRQSQGSADLLLLVDLTVHMSAHLFGFLENGKGKTSHFSDVDRE